MRNKDRMAIEPIVCLTKPTVLDVLEEVTIVVHTVVPESVASGNQIKVGRPLYAKDQSPLNVEPKAKLLGCSNILENLKNNRTNVIALRDLCILPILRRFL